MPPPPDTELRPEQQDDSARDAQSFHAKLLDSLFDGVYFVDVDRRITYWNRGSENLTGYSAAEAVGRHCHNNFLSHVDAKGCALCKEGCPLFHTIQDGERRQADVFLRHKSGQRVPVCVRTAPITDELGHITGAVEVFSDITARRRVEKRVLELEGLAFRDSLTSLPNRRYTELKVKQALEESRQFDRTFGILVLDIDHFKKVNDDYGHDAGDAILATVAGTLAKSLRDNDLAGRWGGEEFLILVSDMSWDRLREVSERCRALVERSEVTHGSKAISVTISIGATLLRKEDSFESAVRRADQLMYRSKSAGRNRRTVG
jgi:diguanylate cyclase (GGDEF)-like protein/PAS domain S-box-containing protein